MPQRILFDEFIFLCSLNFADKTFWLVQHTYNLNLCSSLPKGMPTAITGEDDHEVLARRRRRQPGVTLPNHQGHGM